MNSRLSRPQIIEALLTSFDHKVKKSRARSRINKLFELSIANDEEVQQKLCTHDGRQFFINLFGEF